MSEARRPLRGAIIGYGFIASRGHVPAYAQRRRALGDVEITAVADVCAGRRELAREALPEARIYTDAEILLEAEAGAIDFIDIATPPALHAEQAAAALGRGLHVLCEKPLATRAEDAAAILQAARRNRRVIFPCHNYKHAPVVRAIREILDSGRIGKVHAATLHTFRDGHAKGVAEWRPDWRRERRFSGGGIAMDHGCHAFYLAFDWLGSYPLAVTAKTARLGGESDDTEDLFSAVLSFPTGLAQVHLSWKAGERKVWYSIHGSGGAITVDDDELWITTPRPESGTASVERRVISSHWEDPSHVQWFSSLLEEFRAAIDGNDLVGKQAREACLCVELIDTAYRSDAQRCLELPLTRELPGGA